MDTENEHFNVVETFVDETPLDEKYLSILTLFTTSAADDLTILFIQLDI
jgi:hypothetical protein